MIDPAGDRAAVSNAVIDQIREQFLARIGFEDPLRVRDFHNPA